MRVYYAHSRQIYGTDRERQERDFISDMFRNCEVVCPNRDMGELGSLDPYLAMVEKSDIVVCTELDELVGIGVFSEVKHARKIGKPVFIMRGFRFYPATGQQVVDRLNEIRYGRLISSKRGMR